MIFSWCEQQALACWNQPVLTAQLAEEKKDRSQKLNDADIMMALDRAQTRFSTEQAKTTSHTRLKDKTSAMKTGHHHVPNSASCVACLRELEITVVTCVEVQTNTRRCE